jgi:hypothetical protein
VQPSLDRRTYDEGTAMIVNPFLDLKLVRDEGLTKAVTVRAPVKGESLKVTTIDRNHDREVFEFLLIYMATKGVYGADRATDCERERLTEIGFLVRQAPIPVFYTCDFDDSPSNLLPLHAQRRLRPPIWNDDLIVDPTFRHLGKDGITPEMRGRYKLASPLHVDRSWFSIEDGLSAPVFYSYAPGANACVDLLSAGQPVPENLSFDARHKLVETGVVRLRGETSTRGETRERQRAAAHKTLVEKRYVILREIIQSVQLANIRRYYRNLIDEGFVQFGDSEWPDRFFSSRDGLAYFFQQQLTGVISEIAEEKLKPSFSFFASYRPGSDLKPHRDREQCQYAISVLLDHDHADDVSSWPIYVQPPGAPEAVAVNVGLGDGLLYFGREVLHYRYPLAHGYSTLWFLFWMPENFEGSLD